MVFYVLLTHGVKPSEKITGHPAARAQLTVRKAVQEKHPRLLNHVVSDYARRVQDISALPELKTLLMWLREKGEGLVFVDDLARIFRVVPFDMRMEFLSQILEYSAHIFSIHHKKKLVDFSEEQKRQLVMHPEKSKTIGVRISVANQMQGQTREASIRSRAANSDKIQERLDHIAHTISEKGGKCSMQAIATEANRLELRTAHGKKWTRQNVARAIKNPIICN